MFTYTPSRADKADAPSSYPSEKRYLGYHEADTAKPYAKYFREDVLPMQSHVPEVLLTGMAPTEYGYDIEDAPRMLSKPGYHKMETGWTTLDSGVVVVNCLTDMPGVTGEMWDWWFAWHSCESARYKLWHPEAHQYTAVGELRLADHTLTDRQRYIDNVSYVDEYVGGILRPLAIRFLDPSKLGFEDSSPGSTVIAARVGLSVAPIAFGWIVHQVRATDSGAEMRSRFFLNHPQHLDLPATSIVTPPTGRSPVEEVDAKSLGVGLLSHCAIEMNHLASFLPALYEEFKDIL
jgi:DAPG hydrolase PhiG domain